MSTKVATFYVVDDVDEINAKLESLGLSADGFRSTRSSAISPVPSRTRVWREILVGVPDWRAEASLRNSPGNANGRRRFRSV